MAVMFPHAVFSPVYRAYGESFERPAGRFDRFRTRGLCWRRGQECARTKGNGRQNVARLVVGPIARHFAPYMRDVDSRHHSTLKCAVDVFVRNSSKEIEFAKVGLSGSWH